MSQVSGAAEKLDIAAVNAMGPSAFVAAFGDLAESSPWVAEEAEMARPFTDRAGMAAAFRTAILEAGEEDRLALIQAHPDLAGRAAVAGTLTVESRREQKGAGLDRLTPEEFARFQRLNADYREKFGFPFIYAVKGATKDMILDAFAERLRHDRPTEFRTALEQVARIIAFRIDDRVTR